MTSRPSVSAELERRLMVEAGHRCAIPTCRAVGPLQLEHIDDWSRSKRHDFENMIVLCANCHGRKGNRRGQIDRKSLYQYKANLAIVNSRYGELERRVLDYFSRVLPTAHGAAESLSKMARIGEEAAGILEAAEDLGPEAEDVRVKARRTIHVGKLAESALAGFDVSVFNAVEMARGSHFLLSYLIKDGYLERAPDHIDNIMIDGRPVVEIFRLTEAGQRFVDRWKSARPLDEDVPT
ncbi:HNH endonuclease signature motif containing protein [Micromonospora sp. NPDC005172]|uniref:HNH endonuclease n=1 Tax=Micromonospora sp. NPDC005172 TaxID=3156867 RepID=UPI0033A8F28C